ncbi:unnamed protein product [marine sediment metagenome]|uniref:Uncharacterized protein n=1 Tax=marine sediment metagenome TaxID=412755 RepID=X1UQ43_9ZZZZ
MLLNLNDPESILTWWTVLPDQHDAFLAHKLRISPEFAPAIKEAQRRIATSPELNGLLAHAIQRRRQGVARRAEQDATLPAYELRRRELETA